MKEYLFGVGIGHLGPIGGVPSAGFPFRVLVILFPWGCFRDALSVK